MRNAKFKYFWIISVLVCWTVCTSLIPLAPGILLQAITWYQEIFMIFLYFCHSSKICCNWSTNKHNTCTIKNKATFLALPVCNIPKHFYNNHQYCRKLVNVVWAGWKEILFQATTFLLNNLLFYLTICTFMYLQQRKIMTGILQKIFSARYIFKKTGTPHCLHYVLVKM